MMNTKHKMRKPLATTTSRASINCQILCTTIFLARVLYVRQQVGHKMCT